MSLLHHPGPRQRFFLVYVAVLGTAVIVLATALPGHTWAILATASVAVAVAWAVLRVGDRRLRHRLRDLRETTDAISCGDFQRRIEPLPNDDFVKLAEALDRMAAQLRARIEEEDRLRRQLTRSEKLALIGELAATVAHEINNPLDGLQASTRIIRRDLDNVEQVHQLLDLMDAGLHRIEMIVRRLLTMSRDDPVNLVPVRVDDILDDAVVFVQPRLQRYGIELVRDFPDDPVSIMADPIQFAQALVNLMINAADSMRRGGTLTVRCRARQQGRHAVLEVIDTGEGIPEEHRPHIFEPFYTTKSRGGTGLGLAIVARIVEAHEGRIEVDTEVGRGTRFRITLARATPEAVGGQRSAVSGQPAAREAEAAVATGPSDLPASRPAGLPPVMGPPSRTDPARRRPAEPTHLPPAQR